MSNHYSVIGPPGTGKTTYLKRQVERAASVFGGDGVLVCSLTRAAAAEIKGRTDSIREDRVGTLHSFAFRAIGMPELAESKLDDWNSECPEYGLSESKKKKPLTENDDGEEPDGFSGDAPGDECHDLMEMYRHNRRPREMWRDDVRAFAARWDEWKHDNDLEDFAGFIERALETNTAPGAPLAIFVDEAQDMSRLEIDLIRHWATETNTFIAVGDPAQALFTFRGAMPDAFFDVGSAEHRRILAQSYRVPGAVHAAATAWAGNLLDGVEYMPTDVQGSVREAIGVGLDDPENVAEALISDLDRHSGTVMFQAQTNKMVDTVVRCLKDAGIPFHNPNRTKNGLWNPLARRKKSTSTVDRFLAWQGDKQTPASVLKWLPMIKSTGVLKKGAKKAEINTPEDIIGLFESEGSAMACLSGDVSWLRGHVTNEYAGRLGYICRVFQKHGRSSLEDTPRLLVGTVHSYKGAEADSVWLAPDLSFPAWNEYENDELPARRLFYVGMTRARHDLHIMEPKSGMAACLL